MRKLISSILALAFLALALPLATAQPALAATDYSTVRVLLSNSGATTISIAVRGNYFIKETGATFSGGTLTVKNSGGKVVLSHSAAGQLYSGSSVNVMRESNAPSAGYMSMVVSGRTRSYLGHFLFKASGSGVRVVNTVPIQHYLYGVVAFEMSNNFPIEALKAQAVAAKCYVLSGMSPTSDYDIGDTASDQVYKGYDSSYTAVMAAVDETYDVWLFLGSSILCSYFAASNGGYTILPSDTWAGTNRYLWDKAYDRREDPYDVANPLTVQETTFYPSNGDAGNISAALSNYLRNRTTQILRNSGKLGSSDWVVYINSVDNMVSKGNTTADIALTVTIQYANGATEATSFSYTEDFAYLVSNGVFTKAQSLRLYVVTQKNGGWEVRRGRYGHGVGLSQRGAEQMARQGMKYQQILNFYYPGASIRSMGLTMPSDAVNSSAAPSTGTLGNPIATAVATGNVNFRQGPSTKTSSLGTVPKNTNLNVYAQQDGFSQVVYNNQVGYVSNSYLKITPVTTTTDQSTTTTGTSIQYFGEVTSSTLNFRDKPNTSGKKLQTLKKGDKLDIYGYADNSNSWFHCSANGKTGYVSAQYVKITGTPTVTETPATGTTDSGAVASGASGTINTEGVYLRSKATTSSGTRIASLQKGLSVTILGEDGDYYQVSVSTYTGYVQKQYVNVTSAGTSSGSGSASSATQAGETTGKVNLRKGPGTKYAKVTQLKKGVKLTIHSYSGGWYQVTTADGKEGYVSGDYVKVTSGGSSGSSSDSAGVKAWTAKVVNESVRLRSTASATGTDNILGEYPVGTELIVYHTEGEFYKVSVEGKEGYMHMDYVQVIAETTVAGASSAVGVTSARVNLRSGPNTSGTKVLSVLNKGENVTVLGTEGDFYYAKAGASTGYLYKQYVSVSSTAGSTAAGSSTGTATTSDKSGVTTGNVNMRSAPDTSSSKNILTKLKKGVTITIHSTSGGWHYVTADGKQGYVSAKYVKA